MRWKAAKAAGLAALVAWACGAGAADAKAPTTKPAPKQKAQAGTAAAPPPTAPASTASAMVLDAQLMGELNHAFKTYVAPRFTVLADDELAPEVRALAQAMQTEHLPRVRALMESWLREELQQANPQWAFHRMLARLANEFALWGRDSTGPAQDAALAQALQRPGMCRPLGPKASELVMRLGWLRGLPAEVQQAAIQAEGALLARWGRKRDVSEAEPLAAEEALLQLRATGQAPKTPLPPVLAYYHLGDSEDTRRDPARADPAVRCAMHQWAGATPVQFRAAMAMQVADMLWVDRGKAAEPTNDDDPYPSLPNYLGIRGVVTVAADLNAAGRVVRARVIKRVVEVPGIRGVRPFAHEAVLERASLAKARELDWSSAAPKEGLKEVQREIEWSLKWR